MSKSSPAQPDYVGAANAQGAQSQELATQQNFANRPQINTPWGSQSWQTEKAIDPATGKEVTNWTSNIDLNPLEKTSLEAQQRVNIGRSEAAQQLLGQATSATATPMNWGGQPARAQNVSAPDFSGSGELPSGQLPNSSYSQGDIGVSTVDPFSFGSVQKSVASRAAQTNLGDAGQIQSGLNQTPGDYRQTAQDAVWNLQKPMLDERRDSVETQLANQGLARGTEAWDREMRNVDDAEARARLAAVSEGRAEAGQLFNQELASGQFVNSAQGQRFGQNVTAGNFFNQGQGQNFGQDMAAAGLNNQGQAQEFGQGAQATSINNAAAGQQAQMNQTQAGFENTAAGQQFQQLMQRVQAGDSRALQELQAQIQAGGFNNANRSGAISETMQQRSQPLNELNALLSGQQIGMPQFPSAGGAATGQPTDLMSAMQGQYGAALDQSNARNAANNSAAQAAAMAAMYYFSDARLKEEIQTVGILRTGVRVVHYRYRGLPGRYVGVIAQELAAVQPEAVFQHPSGYLMVDYSKVIQ